jgi:hypothetical protein
METTLRVRISQSIPRMDQGRTSFNPGHSLRSGTFQAKPDRGPVAASAIAAATTGQLGIRRVGFLIATSALPPEKIRGSLLTPRVIPLQFVTLRDVALEKRHASKRE